MPAKAVVRRRTGVSRDPIGQQAEPPEIERRSTINIISSTSLT